MVAQLQELFKSHAIVKLLDFLTLYKEFAYTKTELIRETGIGRRTIYQVWPLLEEFNLIKMERQVGQARLYKFNTENPIAKALVRLTDEITFYSHRIRLPTMPVQHYQIRPEQAIRDRRISVVVGVQIDQASEHEKPNIMVYQEGGNIES